MIGAFLTFLFLFGLVWFFERKNHGLDVFQIVTVVVVPLLVYLLFFAIKPLGVTGIVFDLAAFTALVLATFFVLFKTLGIHALRSVLYTGAVVVFSVSANAMLPWVLG